MAPYRRARKGSKEPIHSAFTQQELPAYKPVFTPKKAIATFIVIGFVFIPIGAICLAASHSVIEVSARYDDVCISGASTNAQREAKLMQAYGDQQHTEQLLACDAPPIIRIPHHMKHPIFMYYELSNYFQNHRRYMKSRSDAQLRGGKATATSLADCQPEQYSRPANNTGEIDPCGLAAWSYFNDTFSIDMKSNSSAQAVVVRVPIAEDGIAWKSDVKKKFGLQNVTGFNTDHDTRGGGSIVGPLQLDEHFIVWMRMAVLPTFRKLWGRIEVDLPAGATVRMNIQNRYNTYRFHGHKRVVLSTASWLGGRNHFLGLAYLSVGGASILLGLLFALISWCWPRKMGDVSQLSWNCVHHVRVPGTRWRPLRVSSQ